MTREALARAFASAYAIDLLTVTFLAACVVAAIIFHSNRRPK